MAKILLTGGAGFIGSHVVDAYIKEGHEVAILDNLSTGRMDFINPSATFFEADIKNFDQVSKIISEFKPEIINHHAAQIQVGYSVAHPQEDAQNNVIGLLNIMEIARNHDIKKIVMASTGGAVYGKLPTPFREEMQPQPVSPYAVSKRAGELYLHFYFEEYGIEYVVLRYSNVYGPRQNPHGESGVIAIFSELITQGKQPIINGDGNSTRDYIFVTDVVDANLKALQTEKIGIFNIGTGVETTTNQVFHKVVDEFGIDIPEQHGPRRPGEQPTSVLSYEKAKAELNWEPKVNFDEGVKLVANWYRQKLSI